MSFMNQDNPTSDSDPIKLEVESEIKLEVESEVILDGYSEEATSAEVFVKEISSSSRSSEAGELAADSHVVDIEPHEAASVEFNDTNATPNKTCTATDYCIIPFHKWPVLEIIPGGFASNNTTLDEDFTTPTTVHTPSNITKSNDPPQIDIPKYLLMGQEKTYLGKASKMYSCAKCDESFDVMLELTKHLKTHLPKRKRMQHEIKLDKCTRRSEELLILCVRAQRCLWDKSSPEYEDTDAKDKAWREVTKQCRIANIYLAKEKWNNFKITHRSMVKREKRKLGETSEQWMHMDIMQFLLPNYSNTKKRKPPEDKDERLIMSIRSHPCLWDATPCHGQRTERRELRHAKELAWLDVINECDICDVVTAKNKWNGLRNIHRDVLKQKMEGSPEVKWKYASLMRFLPPYRQNKKRCSQSPDEVTEADVQEDKSR